MTLGHDELQADCGLYVLGALAVDERRRFEAHLPTCDECTTTVAQLRAVADALPYAVPFVEPSPGLRGRIIDAASRARSPRSVAAPIPFERHDRSRPTRSVASLVGFLAAAAMLVVAVGLGVRASNLQNQLRDTEARLSGGADLVLVIDVQGARQVRQMRRGTIGVFVLPPSFEALEQRLRGRSKDSEAAIHRRLATAREEIAAVEEYDYVIVNDELDSCVDRLRAIVLAERSRRSEMGTVVADISRSFAGKESV